MDSKELRQIYVLGAAQITFTALIAFGYFNGHANCGVDPSNFVVAALAGLPTAQRLAIKTMIDSLFNLLLLFDRVVAAL